MCEKLSSYIFIVVIVMRKTGYPGFFTGTLVMRKNYFHSYIAVILVIGRTFVHIDIFAGILVT